MYLEPYIYSAAGQSMRLIFIIDNLRFVSIDDYKIIDNSWTQTADSLLVIFNQ